MTDCERSFQRLMGQLDYPLLIVTARAGDQRAGCLVGFASQVSIHPPRFMACLSIKNFTYRVARTADVLVVHFLPEGAEELAALFGGETGDDTDKFARCRWSDGPAGVPVLSELGDWFAGRVLQRLDFGDHQGFLLEPVAAAVSQPDSPLTFRRARWIEPGHAP